jgi:hypothetical protein
MCLLLGCWCCWAACWLAWARVQWLEWPWGQLRVIAVRGHQLKLRRLWLTLLGLQLWGLQVLPVLWVCVVC